jgi:hypothetical protein
MLMIEFSECIFSVNICVPEKLNRLRTFSSSGQSRYAGAALVGSGPTELLGLLDCHDCQVSQASIHL